MAGRNNEPRHPIPRKGLALRRRPCLTDDSDYLASLGWHGVYARQISNVSTNCVLGNHRGLRRSLDDGRDDFHIVAVTLSSQSVQRCDACGPYACNVVIQ